MSFSICLLGNSHIAAVKQAWTNRGISLKPDVSVDFFSANAALLRRLELDGTVWRCGSEDLREKIAFTSGGMESIDLLKYDAFVVIGTGFGFDISKFTEGWDIASSARKPEGPLVSQACAGAIIEALFEDSDALPLIDTIRSVSDKPVLLCAAPCLSERLLTEEEPFLSQKRYHDPDFLNAAVALAKAAGKRASMRHGVELIWQDDETIGMPGFTKAVYGINPIRFTMRAGLPPVDRRHGNEEYGFIMLGKIMRKLHDLSGGKVLTEEPERLVGRSG